MNFTVSQKLYLQPFQEFHTFIRVFVIRIITIHHQSTRNANTSWSYWLFVQYLLWNFLNRWQHTKYRNHDGHKERKSSVLKSVLHSRASYVYLYKYRLFFWARKYTDTVCTGDLILDTEVARLKLKCLNNHCKKILHLAHPSIVQTAYHYSHIRNSNSVTLTKVYCHFNSQPAFQLLQYR